MFAVGDHQVVVASYNPAIAEYASSTSEPVEQTVTLGGTTTALVTYSTTTWSEGVSDTATIAPVPPATGTATGGTVNFRSNGTSLTGCAAIRSAAARRSAPHPRPLSARPADDRGVQRRRRFPP